MISSFRIPVFAATLLMVFALPASADEERPASGARYSLIETSKGILRLDQNTGNVSLCQAEAGKLTCKIGADERRAYEQEIDRINRRLDKVVVRLKALEGGSKLTAKQKKGKTAREEEEFDRALKFADRAFRHFFGMVQELKKEEKKDAI